MSVVSAASRWLDRLRLADSFSTFPQSIILSDLGVRSLKFNVHSAVERHRVANYGGEREVLERFLNMLKPTDVVYDIGASIGLYTIAVASFLDQGTVCSFEPDPSTRARLEENMLLNQLDNVHLISWAVSDHEGEVTLYSDGAAGYAPSLVLQDRPGAPTGQVRVLTRPLDLALSRNELPPPDVLKIDIEGAEAACLKGGKQLLEGRFGQRPRMIFLEVHPDFLPAFGSSVEEIQQFMANLGYEACWSQMRSAQEHFCYVL